MKSLYLYLLLLFFSVGYAQTPEEQEWIKKHYDIPEMERMADSIKAVKDANREYAYYKAGVYNWPKTFTDENGNFSELMGVENDTIPIYYITDSADAAISTRTNYLHTGGNLGLDLNGTDMFMSLWDGSIVNEDHQEFAGVSGSRLTQGDNPFGIIFVQDHATHVAGILFSSGVNPDAKGMAPLATGKYYYWDNDQFETISQGQTTLIANYSYGLNPSNQPSSTMGRYHTLAKDWDHICYYARYFLPVMSAGNHGNVNINPDPVMGATGYDKLMGNKTAKNPLIVANAGDATIDANGNLVSVNLNSTSSPGPTDDLRIKPDITGNGTGVLSTAVASNNTSYTTLSGTSMASPNVAGSLLLLQEYSRKLYGTDTDPNFMWAATLKGLVLHTADDILTPGPDAKSGWGLLNAKRAAETMTDNSTYSLISENNLEQGDTYTVQVLSDGINPLSVSISWTDKFKQSLPSPALNSPTAVLVNNLNLKVTKGPDVFRPYYLTSPTSVTTGINNVDPYERVDIPNASGYYTIEVSHSGTLDSGDQDYALIVTGIAVCTATDTDIIITENVDANENDTEHALENITANNTVDALAKAHYRAGISVDLTDGFHAVEDSDFLAHIGDCGIIGQQSFGSNGRKRPHTPEHDVTEITDPAKKLLLYPNPASGSVTAKLDSGMKYIVIIGMDGKAVIEKQVNSKEYTLNIAHLERGMYIISIETRNGELINDKLIIN